VLLQEKLISIREAVPYYRHLKKDVFVYGRHLLRDTSVNKKDLEKDLLVFCCKQDLRVDMHIPCATLNQLHRTLLYSRRGPVPYI